MIRTVLPFLIYLLMSLVQVHAYENFDLELGNESSLNITRFAGESKTLFLWIPSERGFGEGYVPVALDLEAMDYPVWAVNLHESYIIPPGRNSLDEVEIDDLVALYAELQKREYEAVYIITSSRGMQLALKSTYLWQQADPEQKLIRGVFTFSPHLVKGRTEMGQDAEYLSLAAYSNLPVYMIQAQHSTKFARSREIAYELARGGSQVFVHYLSGVQGGFHMRPEEDLTDRDLQVRAELAQIFESALPLLGQTRTAPLRTGFVNTNDASETGLAKTKEPVLHPYKGQPAAPALMLEDLGGNPVDLTDLRDQVVLVNFWATWCGPCVEEIPSLSRLVQRLQGQPFKVIAVNIGESAQDIKQFMQAIPVNFDILLDPHGEAVREWKVYAYPSNYLIDRQGKIRYAYRGALQWDSPRIVQTIESLL